MTFIAATLAISVYITAYLTAWALQSRNAIDLTTTRFQTIDGLRGFLALGVFIHHSYIWYFFLQGQAWRPPESHLYNQLGQSGVALFFMITSFLFVSKLLNCRDKPFNWSSFFISRWYRLAPLYYLTITLTVIIVMYLSNWQLRVTLSKFLTSLFHLSTFTITKSPILNGCSETLRINTGVLWSLPFEWLFYFGLPLIGLLLLKKKPAWPYLLISLIFITFYTCTHVFKVNQLISFAGGAIAPFLMRSNALVKLAQKWYSSILILGCIWVMSGHRSSDEIPCKLALILLFTIVALGNNLFGLLKNKVIQFLGEMAYSTYLLHGIVLFVAIRLVLGMQTVSQFSQTTYVGLIVCLTPVVVLISFLGFKLVEKPFMERAKIINKRFESDKSSREFQS